MGKIDFYNTNTLLDTKSAMCEMKCDYDISPTTLTV